MTSVTRKLDRAPHQSAADLLRNWALVIPCLFTSFAAFLLLARSNLVSVRLSPFQTLALGFGALIVTGGLRWCCGFPKSPNRSQLAKWSWYLQSLTVLQLTLLISLSSTDTQAVSLLGVFTVASETLWWVSNCRFNPVMIRTHNSSDATYPIELELEARLLQSLETNSNSLNSVALTTEWSESELPEEASQSWVRFSDTQGESIMATQRVLFESGQRHQTLHLSFIPGLPSIPIVDATALAGPDVTILVGETQDFGIRLDLKLSETYDEAVDVLIQVEIFAEAKQAA